ncbi:hypothetical protein AGMMS50276_30220 [Synergistales bacterium]|nr:hypothetical protein AGMMS50276_30220 [Synergistales bacterium]
MNEIEAQAKLANEQCRHVSHTLYEMCYLRSGVLNLLLFAGKRAVINIGAASWLRRSKLYSRVLRGWLKRRGL